MLRSTKQSSGEATEEQAKENCTADDGKMKTRKVLSFLSVHLRHCSRKKKAILLLVLMIVLWYSIFPSRKVRQRIEIPDHGYKVKIVPYSEDIDNAGNRRIFYLETSGRPYLTRRQCCTVESAAKNNPDRPIQVFMAADQLQMNTSWLKVLENYSNIQIVLFDMEDYFTGTPLDEWYHEEEWKDTMYRVVHLSDYMRVLTLLKGGGMYMDLDYIVLKSFDEKNLRNFVLVETDEIKLLSNSVIHFDKGHWFIDEMIKRLNKYYEPIDYMFHGPGLITNLMARMCNLKRGMIESNNCTDIRVLAHTYFCPISNILWYPLFENATSESMAMVSESYGIHTWSGKTKKAPLDLNSNQLFAVFAREHCPHTVANTDNLSSEVDPFTII